MAACPILNGYHDCLRSVTNMVARLVFAAEIRIICRVSFFVLRKERTECLPFAPSVVTTLSNRKCAVLDDQIENSEFVQTDNRCPSDPSIHDITTKLLVTLVLPISVERLVCPTFRSSHRKKPQYKLMLSISPSPP